MKTALITTTINVPHVLALYRKYGPDVRFFVAGDHKSPHDAIIEQLNSVVVGGLLPNSAYLPPDSQTHWKCSELIGWNCIQRRNIALLEALKWGADVIVTIDDDNIPLNDNYFCDFETSLVAWDQNDNFGAQVFHGLKASSPSGWFDVGQLLQPVSPHRGFPHDKQALSVFDSVVGAHVGVAAGICLGDPDISAVTRIANGPTVHGVSEVLRSGVVVDPAQTKTVWNTQNTAFIRDLAPAMFCPPGLGRFDDIVASLVCQRVMESQKLHVHFGKPFIFQQRNQHNLVKDLEAELWGMLNIVRVAEHLNKFPFTGSVLEQTRKIYQSFAAVPEWFPKKATDAALAFCDDCELVL